MACGCGPAPVLPKKIKKEALEELTENTKLVPAEVKALYRRFRLMAPSGYLFPDQFRQTMGVLGLTDDPFLPDRMFLVFDMNSDGKLSFFEFASSLAVMIRGTEDEKLKLSFEMTAGRRGAAGISFGDFQQLIIACNSMMQSIVTPEINPVDAPTIRRMFTDLSSEPRGGDGEAMITMEDYKAAAQSNDDFLMCLGLQPPITAARGRRPERDRRRLPTVGSAYSSAYSSSATSTLGSSPAAGGQGHYLVSAAQLEELRSRVETLREVVLQDKAGGGNSLESGTSSSSRPAAASFPREDPEERWWTPLPSKLKQMLGCGIGNSSGGAVNSDMITMEQPTTMNDLASEFDKVLGLLVTHGGETQVDGYGRSGSKESAFNTVMQATPSSSSGMRQIAHGGATQSREDSLEDRVGRTMVNVKSGASPSERPSDWDDANFGTKDNQSIPMERSETATSRMTCGKHRSQTPATAKRRKRHRLLGPKKGLAVHFGHENWNMVLSMMIGIRMSVGRIKHEMSRELTPVDFIMKEKFSIIPRLANIFDSEVSKRVTMTRFIDYAPLVFQRIRASFGIHPDDYLRSVGPEQLLGNMVLGNLSSLSELSSEGKSGAFFYYTADGKYMMKTVTPKEQQLLKRMLKRYYDHITKNTNTLIVRFLGLHCLRVRKIHKGRFQGDKRLHFVVMGNMFNAPFEIHRRYDLKGSWVGRVTPGNQHLDPSIALKDVDFKQACEAINVGSAVKDQLIKTIESDSAFLRDNNVIDYSLLLGIHHIGAPKNPGEDSDDVDEGKAVVQIRDVPIDQCDQGKEYVSQAMIRTNTTASNHPGSPSSPQAGGCYGMQREVPVHQRDLGGLLSADQRQLYFFGIIDILTPYDSMKRIEHHVKALRHDRRGVSCCPPVFYAERFNDFMRIAFK